MEPVLRSAQVLKQEAEEIGFEGKDILEYVKEQQKLEDYWGRIIEDWINVRYCFVPRLI